MGHALTALESASMNGDVTVLRTVYPARDLSMIDVLNAGCSKGHALERWARHRGYRREQVMAVGDNHNDVEMLEFAGHPVIMGNACEELLGRGPALLNVNTPADYEEAKRLLYENSAG